MDKLKYLVILSIDPNSNCGNFLFSHLCHKVTSDKGTSVLCLRCSKVDISHPVYADITALTPKKNHDQSYHEGETNIHLLHSYILTIINPPFDEKKIGFENVL